ncbi:MAG: alpha/beta hydrolase [Bacilli bacterium]
MTADASEGAVKNLVKGKCLNGMQGKETFKIFRNKDKRINFVSTPTLEFFMAGGGNRPAYYSLPRGAYRDIWYVNEGVEIAERLSKAGISCAVLKYRIPDNTKGALMDIQRAIRFARANAKELNINPDKIGVMGFSAGANLSARASATDKSAYENVDGIDEISCKPDCTVLVYPAYCDQPTYDWRWNGKEKPQDMDYSAQFELSKNLKIDSSTPPAFIVQPRTTRLISTLQSHIILH